MPHNWKTYKLGEICEVIGGGTPSTKKTEYYNGDISWITPRDLSGYNSKYIKKGSRSITKLGLQKSSAKIMPKGTVLLSSRAPIGYLAIALNEISTNQGFKSLVVNQEFCYNEFIYYLLKNNVDVLLQNASGSTFQEISGNVVKGLSFPIPPLPEQRAIASILSTIDDQIENNLAMNKTLEEMAMALYKHWFVDFGPFQEGNFVESELGEIPEGWEVKTIGGIIETLGGGTPSTKKEEYWKDGEILWYSPTDLTKSESLFTIEPAKKITELGLKKSSAKLFPPRCLLMSSRATIGALSINLKEASTNQGFITMVPNEELSVFQLYGWAKYNMDLIISKANGSTFKEISKTNFRALPILKSKKTEEFVLKSKNIFDLIENNIVENQTLIAQRDALLPKLVSGEVRVKGFE